MHPWSCAISSCQYETVREFSLECDQEASTAMHLEYVGTVVRV